MIFDIKVSDCYALRCGLCKAILRELERVEKNIKALLTSDNKASPKGTNGAEEVI